jgi:hypothetical protein
MGYGRLCASSRLWSAGSIAKSSIARLIAVSSSGATTSPSNAAGAPLSRSRRAAEAKAAEDRAGRVPCDHTHDIHHPGRVGKDTQD